MIASSESPLYQPSIQVSTILMVSSPPSMNCLQLMVERSSTTAFAGAEDNSSMAANRIEPVVFILFSPFVSRLSAGIRFRKSAPACFHTGVSQTKAESCARNEKVGSSAAYPASLRFECPGMRRSTRAASRTGSTLHGVVFAILCTGPAVHADGRVEDAHERADEALRRVRDTGSSGLRLL